MYARLSWSTLKMIEECPQRFLLHRERKRKPIPEKIVMVGNTLHYASEQFLMRSLPTAEIVKQAEFDFDRRVSEAVSLGLWANQVAEKRESVTRGAWRLAEIYESLLEGVGIADIKPEMHLFKFFPEWAIEGYMDLVVMRDGVPVAVFDVKTGTSHVVGQLQFYSVLLEAYFGVRPERLAWIEPLARGVVDVVVTEEEHKAMKLRIMKAVRRILNSDFPTEGFPKRCGWCSSEPFCPATKKAREMRIA